jgi:steroid delta-isomerase
LTVLDDHVASFNEGVRTGDWSSMLARLADDAELEFTGIPVGPFRGRDAIGDAYAAQPPDDEIVLLDQSGAYAWARAPAEPAGELHLTLRDGSIAKILVVYGQ